VCHDGEAADDQVAHFGIIEGAQNGFDIGEFHVAAEKLKGRS